MKTVLQAGMAKKVPVKKEETVKFFKKLLAYRETLPQSAIDKFKLKYSRPFKTPGPNKVHSAAFKRFDSLASLLLEKVKATNQCAAFKGIPETLHATMVNYSILKQNPKATSVLYVDMKKAFDSVFHSVMRKTVGALNLPASITKYIQGMLGSRGFTISNVDKTKSMKDNRVNVKRGIMQGCALAPCLFVIGMDIISYQINKESMLPIGHEEGETVADTPDSKHIKKMSETAMTNHISFVDDMKIFAMDNATIKRFKVIFESVALQLGFYVNAKKCGVLYNNKLDNVMLENISKLTDCYKYLGIPKLGRSICVETLEKSLEKKILGSVCQVFKTKLNIGQKIKWFNSSIAPAIGYAVAHALPAVKQGILPSLCKRLDKLVIKILAGNITDSEQIE
ncbi:Reverse transcriptase domain-containing protein, partial [Strongyloides ratti]